MSVHSDRNLLLGILALQMDFITRDQLIAALSAWVLEKTRPLNEILLGQSALTSETNDLLVALVDKHVQLHHGDPAQSLAAVSSIGSLRLELHALADAEIEATMARVPEVSGAPAMSLTQSFAVSKVTTPGNRFRVLRPHARGGLGEVSLAVDNELNRQVALKEIQERYADDADSRSRFLMEAEVTGSLEHPGIVPVYGLGQYADGRPFYAMRFIRGASLQDACRRFHRGQMGEGERALELRKLLGRFVDVCEAVDYAHSRGVLHRDLKPGNVMLGKYGETMVVDWGLAKAVGRSESTAPADEMTLKPSSANDTAPTQMGTALGTPQYMSPEQAAGRLNELGPASDVYSLGATLYYVLTGSSPLSEEEPANVLRRVQAGDFKSPREVRPTVPRPLEAICLRAMALKPGDRYATPRDLADDVERWLADEPVAAWPESLAARSGRWVRRHQMAASLLAVTLLLSSVALAATTWFVEQQRQVAERHARAERVARQQEVQARDQAIAARDEADELRGEAERQRDWAATQMRAALANQLAAQSQTIREDLPTRSALLVLEAVDLMRRHGEPIRALVREQVREARLSMTGVPLQLDVAHIGIVRTSRDGNWIASGARSDGRAVLVLQSSDPARPLLNFPFEPGGAEIRTIEFSPDGRWLAATQSNWFFRSRNSQILFVDLSRLGSGQVLETNEAPGSNDDLVSKAVGWLTGHAGRPVAVAFSPDSAEIAAGTGKGMVTVWDVGGERSSPAVLRESGASVTSLAFSPDGHRLASGDQAGPFRVWARGVADEYLLEGSAEFGGADGRCFVAFAADSKWLVTGCGQQVGYWELSQGLTGEPQTAIRMSRGVVGVVPHPNLPVVVVASPMNQLELHGLDTSGQWRRRKRVAAPSGHGVETRLSHDARWIASASGHQAQVTRLADDASWLIPTRVIRHDASIGGVDFTSDGEHVLSTSRDGTLRSWKLTSHGNREPKILSSGVGSADELSLSRDGRRMVASNTKIRWWELSPELPRIELKPGADFVDLKRVAISPDGNWIAAAGDTAPAWLWDIRGAETASDAPVQVGETDVTTFAFSPDSASMFYVDDRELRQISLGSVAEASPPSVPVEPVADTKFSPDGNWLALYAGKPFVTGHTKIVELFRHQSGAVSPDPWRLVGQNATVTALAFVPRLNQIVTGGSNGSLRVWDIPIGPAGEVAPTANLVPDHRLSVTGVAHSPDGKWLATGGRDNIVMLRNVTGVAIDRAVRVLRGHDNQVAVLTFSGDSRWLATGGLEGNVILWDLTLENPEDHGVILRAHRGQIRALVFSPDHRRLISGGTSSICIWDLDLENVIASLRVMAGRELTSAERRRYQVDRVADPPR